MRCLVLILLAGAAAGQADLIEERFWKGYVSATAVSREVKSVRGREEQSERVEFLLIERRASRTAVARPRKRFELRQVDGTYRLDVDTREGEDEQSVVTKGAAAGRLHARVRGHLEPTTGRYRLKVEVSPGSLVAKTTLSGRWQGSFTTWRTVTTRTPFLRNFDVEGELGREGRVLKGKKTFEDRKTPLVRDVTIRWRLERLDPVLRGAVVDHHGRPLAGLKVTARTTNPARVRSGLPRLWRDDVTDDKGRFSIDAFWSLWSLEVAGAVRDGLVIEGRRLEKGILLRFDDVPTAHVKLNVYRLRALPYARLLRGHFQGDVARYMAYIRERVSARRLQAALVPQKAAR